MTLDNPDRSEIENLVEEIGTIRTSIQKARINHHQEVRAQLTEEQRVIFDTRMQRGFGPGHGMGHGFGGRRGYRGMHGRGWN